MAIYSTFTGRVGADAEVKYAGDTPILAFRAATDRYDGKAKEKVGDWIAVSLFGKRAETLAPMLTKGKTVTVTGVTYVREYEGTKGKGFSLEMKAQEIELHGGGKDKSDAPATEVVRAEKPGSDTSIPF